MLTQLRHLALWAIAMAGLLPAVAHAQTTCSAGNIHRLDWDVQTPLNTNLGTGSRTFSAISTNGGSVNVTMSFAGEVGRYINSGFGQTPNISVQNTGGIGAGQNTLFLANDFVNYVSNLNIGADVAVVRFTFATAVRDVTFTVLDIDFFAGQFRDWVQISGSNGASTYIPTITSAAGNVNTSSPGGTAPSTVYVGPGTVSGAAIANGQVNGITGNSTATQTLGNITMNFPQPITQIELRYGNGPASTMTGTAGTQSISIHDISFCPMPSLTVVKSSTPLITTLSDPQHFNIPGADVVYSITVANTNASTIPAGVIDLTDALPANMTFFNGDFNGPSAGTNNFELIAGTSGVALAPANVTYSTTGTAPWTHTPAAGYAASVRGIRFNPQGIMAENSSFTIRFRMRINN